jgi:uncharacterized GH25 family protein
MKFSKSVGLAAGLVFAIAGSAAAHYTFVMPEKFRVAAGDMLTVGFHAADGFPESARAPKNLQSVQMHSATSSVDLELREDGKRQVASVKAPPGYLIFTAVNPAKTEEMKAASFLKYLEEESLTAAVASIKERGEDEKPGRERYSMYVKSLVLAGAPNDGYKRVVGLPIEIVPEKDPAQIKKGETLPVRVLLKGAPAANLQIFASTVGAPKADVGKTDANGRIAVPVATGLWRLHTIHMERVSLPDADWESLWATLTFEIP